MVLVQKKKEKQLDSNFDLRISRRSHSQVQNNKLGFRRYRYENIFLLKIHSRPARSKTRLLYRLHSLAVSMNTKILGNTPTIKGTRIPVSLIVACFRDGITLDENFKFIQYCNRRYRNRYGFCNSVIRFFISK